MVAASGIERKKYHADIQSHLRGRSVAFFSE
jgi:hypothetical protein